jgi:hypothetical protein
MMVAFQVTISPHPSVVYAFDVEPEVAMYASPSMLFFFLNSHRGRCPSATFDFAQVIPYVHHASLRRGERPPEATRARSDDCLELMPAR